MPHGNLMRHPIRERAVPHATQGKRAACGSRVRVGVTSGSSVAAPDGAWDAAAAGARTGLTACVRRGLACRIGPGDVVVVQAAAGATGGAVVQLAAGAGAGVIAFASSADKAQGAMTLGARHSVAL